MEEGNLSDADTDELLGISGIEPFASSGASIYLTPNKSPPGSPSDLLASRPKRRLALKTSASNNSPGSVNAVSPSCSTASQSSTARANSNAKSPKRAVKKFVDSPGKLTLGDLKEKKEDSINNGVRRSSSRDRLMNVGQYLVNQERVLDRQKVDAQNKENLLNSVISIGGVSTKTNSAPASGTKSSPDIVVGGKSLPSSPYIIYKVENVVVTSHNRPHISLNGIGWSDPNARTSKVPPKRIDPIFTYKRKLFEEDPNQKFKDKTVAEKNKKGQVLKDKSNKKATSPNKKSPEAGVVHSGSPTQNTHCASKYKVSPRRSERNTTAKSPGKQRCSRSLDNSPEETSSSFMKGSGSVSPGRRPGPVTFRKSPSNNTGSPSISPSKYVESSSTCSTKISNSKKYPYPEKSSAHSKFGQDSVQAMRQSVTQHSPEKYVNNNSFGKIPPSRYYSGKPAFTQDGYSNPLDDVLQRYPLSPQQGEVELSLPDSPGMKAAAESIMTADEYNHMPKEVS
jgi:hypothetical protein